MSTRLKPLTLRDVAIQIECLPEDVPVRGNAMASGDDKFDAKVENKIIKQLEQGNEWAWCTVKVTALWEEFSGCDYLGCCSYKSEKDFINGGGYYEDMVKRALFDLNADIEKFYTQLKKREIDEKV